MTFGHNEIVQSIIIERQNKRQVYQSLLHHAGASQAESMLKLQQGGSAACRKVNRLNQRHAGIRTSRKLHAGGPIIRWTSFILPDHTHDCETTVITTSVIALITTRTNTMFAIIRSSVSACQCSELGFDLPGRTWLRVTNLQLLLYHGVGCSQYNHLPVHAELDTCRARSSAFPEQPHCLIQALLQCEQHWQT